MPQAFLAMVIFDLLLVPLILAVIIAPRCGRRPLFRARQINAIQSVFKPHFGGEIL